jgi:outer membrane protein OmpA-like peptidoglycan-associated protein
MSLAASRYELEGDIMNRYESGFRISLVAAAVAAMLALGGCNTLPERNAALEDARAAVHSAQADPQVPTLAGLELGQADEALRCADTAWRDHEDTRTVDHLAYLAQRRASIAIETARLRAAEAAVAAANAERTRTLLLVRTRESERAERDAVIAQRRADDARAQAVLAQAQANTARQDAGIAQVQAAASQQQAQDAEARARILAAELNDLQAQRTDRGMVVTLSDVVFDTGRAELNPGGVRVAQKVADFLNEYPQRTVAIEGFTDSVGNDGLNQELSERRANAVRLTLIDMHVDPRRIIAYGYGRAYPVASNETAAGRQLNRRVEVVISDENGVIGRRRLPPERLSTLH